MVDVNKFLSLEKTFQISLLGYVGNLRKPQFPLFMEGYGKAKN